MKVLGISNGWALVQLKDGKYFCSNKYLSTKKPSSVSVKLSIQQKHLNEWV